MNLLDIKLAETAALKKHSVLLDTPVEKLSQKERNKVARLRELMLAPATSTTAGFGSVGGTGLAYHSESTDSQISHAKVLQQQAADAKSKGKSKNQDLLLVVALDPSLFHAAPKLQYVYTSRPPATANLHLVELKRRYAVFLAELRDKLGLADKYRHLFTKTGEPVDSLAGVIQGDYTFFISSQPSFDAEGERTNSYRSVVEGKFKSLVGIPLTTRSHSSNMCSSTPATPNKSKDTILLLSSLSRGRSTTRMAPPRNKSSSSCTRQKIPSTRSPCSDCTDR